MTPPEEPKMTPAPVPNPKGMSKASGSSSLNLMPKESIMRPISVVVRTKSTSGLPSTLNLSSWASYFFAVQGMMETTTMSLRSLPIICGMASFMVAPNICCGERQEERFFPRVGKLISAYLTQPGQQEVNIGKGPPALTRRRNSSASSQMVMSAAKVVS